MQYQFLTLYHDFDDKEKNLLDAQRSLLFKWWERTSGCLAEKSKLSPVPFIPEAKVEFKDYSFFDYPDQEKTKEYVKNSYGHKRKKKDGGGIEYWWCGTQYPDLDTIYNALAKQKRFMELTITMEDFNMGTDKTKTIYYAFVQKMEVPAEATEQEIDELVCKHLKEPTDFMWSDEPDLFDLEKYC